MIDNYKTTNYPYTLDNTEPLDIGITEHPHKNNCTNEYSARNMSTKISYNGKNVTKILQDCQNATTKHDRGNKLDVAHISMIAIITLLAIIIMAIFLSYIIMKKILSNRYRGHGIYRARSGSDIYQNIELEIIEW